MLPLLVHNGWIKACFFNLNFIFLCSKLCTKIEFRHLACLCGVLSKQSCQDLMWTSAWMPFFTIFSPSRQLLAVCKLKDYCNIPIILQNSANTFQSWPLKLYYPGKTGQKKSCASGQLWYGVKKKSAVLHSTKEEFELWNHHKDPEFQSHDLHHHVPSAKMEQPATRRRLVDVLSLFMCDRLCSGSDVFIQMITICK